MMSVRRTLLALLAIAVLVVAAGALYVRALAGAAARDRLRTRHR